MPDPDPADEPQPGNRAPPRTVNAGGRATSGGVRFQVAVAAFVSAHLVTRRPLRVDQEVDLSSVDWLSMESQDDVDDVQFGGSEGVVFVQAKRTLSGSSSPKSEMAKTACQFVRQYRAGVSVSEGGRRSLAKGGDWLLIVVSDDASDPVRVQLRDALRRRASQPDVALSQKQASALGHWRGRLAAAWRTETGVDATNDELRAILELTRVWVLDVDSSRREGPAVLAGITAEADSAAAWTALEVTCLWMSEQGLRGGPDWFRKRLAAAVRLKAPVALQADVARVRAHTATIKQDLDRFQKLETPEGLVSLARHSLEPFVEAARTGSLLTIGPAGAGKSGLLAAAADLLACEAEVVVLRVDQAVSPGALSVNLQLQHPLLEVLDQWPGRGPAYLILDALDVVRGGPGEATYRSLVGALQARAGRWRVLASVRSFDLKQGRELAHQFKGAPPAPDFVDAQFAAVRHFQAPAWSIADLAELFRESPQLAHAVRVGGDRLRDLVLNPFNMSLLASLLAAGVDPARFEQARTRADLLEAYWDNRVPTAGVGAPHAIADLVAGMLARERLELHFTETAATSAPALEALAACGMLASARDSYRFAHHVLFDYAVARVELSKPGPIAPRLQRGIVNGLLLAPALQFWVAEQALRSSPSDTWSRICTLISDEELDALVRIELARLGAELVSDNYAIDDLVAVTSGPLQRSLGSIASTMAVQPPVAEISVAAWLRLASALPADIPVIEVLRAVLAAFPLAAIAEFHRPTIGALAQRLVDKALTEPRLIEFLTPLALPAMIATFDSDPDATRSLVRRLLEAERVEVYGHQELDLITGQALPLARGDAPTCVLLFHTAFAAYAPDGDQKVPVGTGYILNLTTTVAQNLDMARYHLREVFPQILAELPEVAAQCLAAAVAGFTVGKPSALAAARIAADDRWGRPGRLKPDGSLVWGMHTEGHYTDLAVMLGALDRVLRSASVAPAVLTADAVLMAGDSNLLISRVLRSGVQRVADLGRHLLQYAELGPVLQSRETSRAAIQLIQAVRAALSGAEDAALLARLRGLQLDEDVYELLLRAPAPAVSLTDPPARTVRAGRTDAQIAAEARAAGRSDPRHEWVRHMGGDIESAESRRLLDQADRLKAKTEALDKSADLRGLRSLTRQVLRSASLDLEQSDPRVERILTEQIVLTAGQILRRAPDEASEFEPLADLLLAQVSGPPSAVPPEIEAGYGGSGDYVKPNALVEAVQLVIELASRPGERARRLAATLDTLSAPPSPPAVRGYIASRAYDLLDVDPERVWRIVRVVAAAEPNAAVLADLLDTIAQLAPINPADASAIFDAAVPRLDLADENVAGAIADLRTLLGLWFGQEGCRRELERDASEALEHPQFAQRLAHDLRPALVASEPSGRPATEIRTFARDLLTRMLDVAIPAFPTSTQEEPTERELDAVKLVDTIVDQFFFGAGAFRVEQERYVDPLRGDAAKQGFLDFFAPLLERLAVTGTVRSTHHLVELLTHLAPAAPARAFDLAARAILRPTSVTPYQAERMGQDQVLKLFQLLLADHREIFDDRTRREALVDCIDLFVRAGWPSIRKFASTLPEMLF